MARFVTDYATFAWLCDVFVDAAHRDRGLGTFLVDTAVGHPDVRGVRQILAAEPGRSLYARFGYGPLAHPERWMDRPGHVPGHARRTAVQGPGVGGRGTAGGANWGRARGGGQGQRAASEAGG